MLFSSSRGAAVSVGVCKPHAAAVGSSRMAHGERGLIGRSPAVRVPWSTLLLRYYFGCSPLIVFDRPFHGRIYAPWFRYPTRCTSRQDQGISELQHAWFHWVSFTVVFPNYRGTVPLIEAVMKYSVYLPCILLMFFLLNHTPITTPSVKLNFDR
jgi:hypothetical protein